MGVWVPQLLCLSHLLPHLIEEMSSLPAPTSHPVYPTLKEESAALLSRSAIRTASFTRAQGTNSTAERW